MRNIFRIIVPLICLLEIVSCDDSLSSSKTISLDSNLNEKSEYFIVFGDLQEYTINKHTISYYDSSVKWIMTQLFAGANIKAIMQVGDVTETNEGGQWKLFYDSTKDLAQLVPFFTCTGNHDYIWGKGSVIQDRSSTMINNYAHFPLSDSMIESFYSSNSLENYVAKLSDKNGTRLLVLEFGPRKEVLTWAKEYVASHEDERFILMTHEWLTRYGQRVSIGSYAESQFSGFSSFSTPEEIWNELVKPNDNIICVLCGHNGFTGKLFSDNDAGRKVPQILFNLQYQENGGNGLIQIWEFPNNSNVVNISAYDTINQDWFMTDSTKISFNFVY